MTCGEWSIGSENTAGSAVVIVRSAQNIKCVIYKFKRKVPTAGDKGIRGNDLLNLPVFCWESRASDWTLGLSISTSTAMGESISVVSISLGDKLHLCEGWR